jgi:hypothetical protein
MKWPCLAASGLGKTYAQPVLGDVTLSCAAAKCWR